MYSSPKVTAWLKEQTKPPCCPRFIIVLVGRRLEKWLLSMYEGTGND